MSRFLRALGALLYRLGLARLIIWLNGRGPRVLVYHACEPQESDFVKGLGVNTPPLTFAAHLEFLSRHYRIATLEDLELGTYPDRAVLITFDDGYRSMYLNAYPVLQARAMPATVYLVASTLEAKQLIWINELAWFLARHADVALRIATADFGIHSGATAGEVVRHAQEVAQPPTIERVLERLGDACLVDRVALARDAALYLSREDVAEMARGGIAFGNHTATHLNLANCSAAAALVELSALVGRRVPGLRPSLAYPFGCYTDATRELAAALGHTSQLRVGGVNRTLDLAGVARTAVAAQTVAELFGDIEVVEPVKAWVRGVLRWAPYGHRQGAPGSG